jgi:hypothetical protein
MLPTPWCWSIACCSFLVVDGTQKVHPGWLEDVVRALKLDIFCEPWIWWSNAEYESVWDDGCTHDIQSIIDCFDDDVAWKRGFYHKNVMFNLSQLHAIRPCPSCRSAEINTSAATCIIAASFMRRASEPVDYKGVKYVMNWPACWY